MPEKGLTKAQILSELAKSPHGKLSEYVPIGSVAARDDANFFGHLVAWNRLKGQIRDAKVALPIIALKYVPAETKMNEFAENALAHFASLGPRELLKAYRFALEIRLPGHMRQLRRIIAAYMRDREVNAPKWDRIALQHRHTLKELYAVAHIAPGDRADKILFKGEKPAGSLFETVSQLKDMQPTEAAGAILERKIPFLIARGALGKKLADPTLVLALIKQMSPTELVTNVKALERLGIKTDPALRGAFNEALQKAGGSTTNLLKTTVAVDEVESEELQENLRTLQDKQIAKLSGVEGNWLVLGDMSGSMAQAMELAKNVAATLSKLVKGSVWLTFFNTEPLSIDVTGLTLDQIQKATKHISAGGGTSIGCGLLRMLDGKQEVDGIAIVSDGGENTVPLFPDVYKKYSAWTGKEVPVYLYHCDGDVNALSDSMKRAGLDMQIFELGRTVDYYSIPTLVQTMRTNRYSLIDEVMAVPLLTLKQVLKSLEPVVA
jgi:hypothetical protein